MKKNTKKPAAKKAAAPSAKKASAPLKEQKVNIAEPLRILFVSPEVSPFSGTGGLGEVAGSLPAALNKSKHGNIDCRVISPLYAKVGQKYRDQMKYLGCKEIPVSWRSKYMGVFELDFEGVKYYFIDNEEYFNRPALYGYQDDCERFAFFSRAVFESIEFTGFSPEIMHANDWQTALVPIYQYTIYQRKFMSTIFTIHNVEYQGHYGHFAINDICGIPENYAHIVEYNDDCNLMKGAVETANIVSTVSASYAEELKDPFFSFGLDPILKKNDYKLRGILNGINTVAYDPSKDEMLKATYTQDDISGKLLCKRDLQKMLGLPERDVCLLTMISRLVPAKGVDLIRSVIDGVLINNDVQFVILGTGIAEYENFFRGLENRFPNQVRALIEFNTALSHQVYAAGDVLIMPSKGEPCGLAQMIGARYGDIPLVRATGGLKDSIKDCTLGEGSGFVFEAFDAGEFYGALMNAINLYKNQESWTNLVKYDMGLDFTWDSSATKYIDMYNDVRFKG
ncbi:MAG: glycogen synthase [Eubacterium sp.]|nr:glycogen synthase [Eubacterium sp.]